MPRIHLNIGPKFFAVLAVITPLIAAVAIVGANGLSGMKRESDAIFKDNIHTTQVTSSLGSQLARADELSLQLATATDGQHARDLKAQLDGVVVPAVETGLADLSGLHAVDNADERGPVEQMVSGWRRFVSLRHTTDAPPTSLGARARLSERLSAIFDPLTRLADRLERVEALHASRAHARSVHTYTTSRSLVIIIAVIALLVGVGSVLALIRNVVPRVKSYSEFARKVAAGDLGRRLHPRGTDELSQLGIALDDMVERRAVNASHEHAQAEFVDALQLTETENETHDLLKHQLERSIDASTVVVLNRNNSADRLEPTTPLPQGSALVKPLAAASPRSCLAVRSGRSHHEDPSRDALIKCQLCGKSEKLATCEPLLVGSEVIGAVLVEHDQTLSSPEAQTIRESVSQAAPVLANLRNLAIAETRAATDALTGLPNNRAVRDTIKRTVAHASRTLTPVTAILLDLDHFKQINDTFGHGRGDDVLAAVGSVLQSTVRDSDFVGRYGGEEFLVLLPATETEQGAVVAEKIRAAIAEIKVAGVERPITASCGVATVPRHAGDAEQLIRSADRALYTAKGKGRNRVEVLSDTTRTPSNPAPGEAVKVGALSR
jgi:diguanylate cyclase (GGDEF)-like protein